jgi:thiosulfate dehydrogenase (quinone) large subunit
MFNGIKSNFKEPSYLWTVVILRITIGYFFFHAGWQKLTSGFISKNVLLSILNGWVQHVNALWYKNFLLEYALPHSTIFSYLVTYGEILVGLALIFGFMTRGTALITIIMNLNYELASGWQSGASAIINKLFIICGLVILLSAAGRCFGVDRILHRKYPRIPLW